MSDSEILKIGNNEYLQILEANGDLSITPLDSNTNLSGNNFTKLSFSPEEKGRLNALIGELPSVGMALASSHACLLTFPKGIKGTLMKLRQDGYSTVIKAADGKFAGTASLHPLGSSVMVPLLAFEAMAIASGQYFMTEINRDLKLINLKLDRILDFLYGDKKSELLAEISFVQGVHRNFRSIMAHEEQRLATIVNLQAARKIAMKDIEFYLSDLDGKTSTNAKDVTEFKSISEDVLKIKESLELSIQLYIAANLVEIHVAQNYDESYLANVRNETEYYLNKCNGRMLSDISRMLGSVRVFEQKPGLFNPVAKAFSTEKPNLLPLNEKFESIAASLSSGEESEMAKILRSSFSAIANNKHYYMTDNGDVYLRAYN